MASSIESKQLVFVHNESHVEFLMRQTEKERRKEEEEEEKKGGV